MKINLSLLISETTNYDLKLKKIKKKEVLIMIKIKDTDLNKSLIN